MIELLGVGVPGHGGDWLVRRVCVRVERGVLTAVVARTPAHAAALLDAIAGHVIPSEGRVWVDGRPLMRETAGRIRAAVADVGHGTPFRQNRSALWNTLVAPGHAFAGLLRLPRGAERAAALRALSAAGLAGRARQPMSALTSAERLRVLLARARCWKATAVILRDVDAALGAADAAALLSAARALARAERITVVASLASTPLARDHADHAIAVSEGQVVFDGRAADLAGEPLRAAVGAGWP